MTRFARGVNCISCDVRLFPGVTRCSMSARSCVSETPMTVKTSAALQSFARRMPNNKCSVQTYSLPSFRASSCAKKTMCLARPVNRCHTMPNFLPPDTHCRLIKIVLIRRVVLNLCVDSFQRQRFTFCVMEKIRLMFSTPIPEFFEQRKDRLFPARHKRQKVQERNFPPRCAIGNHTLTR